MDIFPATIATGKAFCNRTKERTLLKQYMVAGRHVVLMAPRRYGKTSLINQSLIELKLPYTILEFTLATTAADIENIVIKHVANLLYQILPRASKAKQNILKLFNWLNPEIVLTAGGQKVVFHPERSSLNVPDRLADILEQLDKAARLVKKRVIVVMDEFQQLSVIANHTIEASIRKAMQYSQQVSYVFSGSNRHLLVAMFNSKNRPFYNSCEVMKLERISEKDYIPFITDAAILKWGKSLPEATINEIFHLSEHHPSYLNRICGYFWMINKFPTLNLIHEFWQQLLGAKQSEFVKDLISLSANQRRVLAYLAEHPTTQPGQAEVCQAIGLSEASIRQATRVLMLKDFLYKDSRNIIRVLDPALRDFIVAME